MDAAQAAEALTPLREMLAADGYELHVVNATEHTLALRVAAGPDACADCLVPKDMFTTIVRDHLPASIEHISVDYPNDAPH